MKPILTFFCFLLLVCPGFAKDKQPNVLFIAVDDLNDWVGCLGGHPQAKTPNIDRLASRGVLFEQAYCSAPLCNPSRMATMTGLRSSTIGIWNNGDPPAVRAGATSWFRDKPELKDWVTIPQYFRQHGYTAVTGGKIFHKSKGKFSDPVSWDHQYSTKHGTPFPRNGRLLHGMSDKMASDYHKDWADWQPLDIPERETADRKTAEGAAAFLRRDHDKPFFLACGIFRPHLRWYAPRKYFDMHPLEKIKLPVTIENDLDDVPPRGRRQTGGSQAFGVIREHGEWKKAVQGYLASCSFADACVGVVLDALEESEHAENTIVVLWGDHGYHVGEKNRISKLTLWEQGSKTPLIISTPDLAATGGKRCKQPVSLVDLYPTLIELCGLPARDGLDGRSIAPLVRNPETEWQYPAVISLRDDHAVRSQRWHYIRYADGGEELYDAAKDPHQWHNLANDTRFADAKTRLKKWLPKNKAATSRSNATRSRSSQKVRPSHEPNAASTAKTSRKRPNVVVLLADDLGWKDIGCYGGPVKTSALDELAAKGVRFTDFYAGAAVCGPSRAVLLTGRHHARAGIYGNVIFDSIQKPHLLEREVTLPEVLKKHGYGTAHFGKWHLGMPTRDVKKPTPAEHGFDYWFGMNSGAQPSHKDPVNFLRNGKPVGKIEGYSCQIVVDEAISWLDNKRDPEAPFFLNLWFHEPHDRVAAPESIVSQYGDLTDQAAVYSATIDNTDRAIARLLDKLKEVDSLENTLVFYTSDNGSYRGDRNGNLRGRKGSNFEGGIRVPGIWYWPGTIKGGHVEHEPAGVVDLLPTVCGLLGIDKPEGVHLDGSDISSLLTGRGNEFARHQPLYWHLPSNNPSLAIRQGNYSMVAYRDYEFPRDRQAIKKVEKQIEEVLRKANSPELLPWVERTDYFYKKFKNRDAERLRGKFMRLNVFQDSWIPVLKSGSYHRFQLFDLAADPTQKVDVSKQHPEVFSRLKRQLLKINASGMAEAPDWGSADEAPTLSSPNPATSKKFVSIFDGKTLVGWTQLNGTATYEVKDGAIVGTTKVGSPNSFLCSNKLYDDFELLFEVKVHNSLNSGVQIRSQTKGGPKGRVNGPQVEIEASGANGAESGYLYGEAAGGWMTPKDKLKPHKHFKDGEWNKFRVLAEGARIQTWINGQQISDLVDERKLKTHPKGFIGLQVHSVGNRGPFDVAWRNIQIRVIKKKKETGALYPKPNPNYDPDRKPVAEKPAVKRRDTQAASKPNVVILLADDLGSQDLGCYGGPVKTPVLDSLAARGVKFTDFHAGAAVCSPSRATLLTGRQNIRTGIYSVLQDTMHNMHLLEREVTIAEALQEAGYGTAHFGKWHIGMTSGKRKKPSPTQHGFDYWFGLSNGAQPSHKDPVNFLRNGKRVGPMKGYSCQIVVSDAIDWLETRPDPDQPFFLNIWFNEPHSKLAAPDEIVSLYGDLKDEAALYSATIDNTDRAIGRLVAKLKDMGQLDNTLIIYSSDHGSYRADRNGGLKGAKGSNFEGGLRSPGIFFWPSGIRGGRIESTPSGAVDLLPTICGLAGIDNPKGVHLDGADLSPLLTEKGTFKRSQPMIWLSPSSGHLATLREGNYTLMGYRGYKLPADHARKNELIREMARLAGIDPSTPNLGQRVTTTTFTSPEYKRLKREFVPLKSFQESWIPTIKAGGFSRFALYDLSADPLQKNDISKQRPKVTERLKKKLLALYKDIMADAPDWSVTKNEK